MSGRPAPWWAQPAPPAGWFLTDGHLIGHADDTGRVPPIRWYHDPNSTIHLADPGAESIMHGRHVDPEGPATEVMEPVRLEDTGQLPALDLGPVEPAAGPVRRRRDESGQSARAWVLLFALLAIAGIAFVAGQVTARTGAVPPPPVPQAAAEVVTAAQMARLWPLVEPDARDTFCGPWARDASWRQAAVDHWVQHLASPRGGQIDVDRATVGEFLDTACARWEGG